ncbi:MAG: acetyltransferase [Gammaproteobacteria bacterium]|nr:MAG: acetyltransferase [Gammaproteobacteria bacterium]
MFAGKGTISLTNCFIGVWPSPQFFSTYAHIEARSKNAFITIGKNTWLNNNATLIADKTSITIGENVLIGHNVFICDSDFHGLEVENRSNGNYDAISVEIGNHVFIGANVTILKGVHIGNNSVVASGSIVSSDIPENVLAGGIPAKVLKNII